MNLFLGAPESDYWLYMFGSDSPDAIFSDWIELLLWSLLWQTENQVLTDNFFPQIYQPDRYNWGKYSGGST